MSGFQTRNSLVGADDLSSALWNATLNSNALFLEAYEDSLWRARQERGDGVLSTSDVGFALDPARQKSLASWTDELHRRRRTLAQAYGPTGSLPENRHMSDPFPPAYQFTFKKDLAPGTVEAHYFVNPEARCASGVLASGLIQVRGL